LRQDLVIVFDILLKKHY